MVKSLTHVVARLIKPSEGHDPTDGFLKGLPLLAGIFVFNASQVGHPEAVVSGLAAALLLLVWSAAGLWPRLAPLICLIGLGYGSLGVALGVLALTLQMEALSLPSGLVLLPLSVPLLSNYWALARLHRRPVALGLNLLYVLLVAWRLQALGARDLNPVLMLGMGLMYVYTTHFIFQTWTNRAVLEARLEEQLQASRDPLTGLRNRRAFNEDYLLGLWHPGLPTGMLLLDIDRFKQVNDTLGHDVGDSVLVEVARLAERVIGTRGRVYRWGGEEFAVLLPGWSGGELAGLAELLRSRVAETSFRRAGHLTVSLGYSGVQPEERREEAFSRIDRALRHAKESGRNRAVGASVAFRNRDGDPPPENETPPR